MVDSYFRRVIQPHAYGVDFDKIWRYLARSWCCLVQNPRLFLMRKLARLEGLRYVIGIIAAWLMPSTAVMSPDRPPQNTWVTCLNVHTTVQRLRQQGLSTGLQLSATVVSDLVHFAHQHPFAVDRDFNLLCRYEDKSKMEAALGYSFQVGSFMTQDCPVIQTLQDDPQLLAIAAEYLGAPPKVVGSELLWSFPAESIWMDQVQVAQVFHYDVDDYRSLKFFFYLTDVDEQSGPHVCIQGTHWGKTWKHQLLGQRCSALSDQRIMETYDAHPVVRLCGNAGFGIAEDPFCFHKGARPISRPRLMLQIQYALNHYGDIRAYRW